MNRRIILGVTLAVVLAVFGWFVLTERPIRVSTAAIENNVPVRVYGLGTVEARIVSDVGFEVGAALTELSVDSGDAIEAGQVIARLHPSEQQAKVARAEAGFAAAEATLGKAEANVIRARAILAQRQSTNARQQELAGRNAVSTQTAEEAQRDVDVAAADLAVAESDVEVAKSMHKDAEAALQYERVLLDHHVLRAPFDAVVVERHVEAGTVVIAGEPIFTLMDPNTVWALAYIDEERAGPLRLGQVAEVRLRSLPHQVFTGKIARIGIESDRVNEERRVWIACNRCPEQVFLGEQAEIWITVTELEDALLVPEIAVTGFDGHEGRIWVAQEGRAHQVSAVFGHRTEDARVELVSGIADGAQLIVAPVKGLSEGRMVRVAERDAP
ncbi:efflux RND transporter periplasmic adaptor subunit [Ruegeria sp. HKCCD4332]|uniref:efflux RND transporter periplasmic adaptor subunit n=1 Tax=Ruegeria sp. HKCCD4332 TaxID=2683021 RepID=UPI0014910EBA|nr:efflux RND transporter periplasmic adaptor subunit [Ruegeria sp. HKCCD4332]NOD78810.1 efflux RND transporter periplasmic adaptor subunit [Ruegeria sp. HKCCD4332]